MAHSRWRRPVPVAAPRPTSGLIAPGPRPVEPARPRHGRPTNSGPALATTNHALSRRHTARASSDARVATATALLRSEADVREDSAFRLLSRSQRISSRSVDSVDGSRARQPSAAGLIDIRRLPSLAASGCRSWCTVVRRRHSAPSLPSARRQPRSGRIDRGRRKQRPRHQVPPDSRSTETAVFFLKNFVFFFFLYC